MATATHRCPACNVPLCRTNSWDSWERSISRMEDAMDAHLPTCGPSNTQQAAQAVADTLRATAAAANPRSDADA